MFEYVHSDLVVCRSLPVGISGANQLLLIMSKYGVKTLIVDNGPPDKRPQRRIDRNGNIISAVGIEHSELAPGYYHNKYTKAAKHTHGTASVTYIASHRCVGLRQHSFPNDPSANTRLALGQLQFIQGMSSTLNADYGWVDVTSGPEPKEAILDNRPRWLFWANYFGPRMINAIGADFLFAAPGKLIQLDSGTAILLTVPDINEWVKQPSTEALSYLRQRVPELNLLESSPTELPDELDRVVQIEESTGAEKTVYQRKRTRGQ